METALELVTKVKDLQINKLKLDKQTLIAQNKQLMRQNRMLLDSLEDDISFEDALDVVVGNGCAGIVKQVKAIYNNTDDTMYTAADFAEEIGYDLDDCFIPQLGRELTAVYKANHGKLPDRIGRTNVYPAYMRVVAEAFLERNFA